MDVTPVHTWALSPTEAVRLQQRLAQQISVEPTVNVNDVKLVAGVDVSFNRYNPLFTAGVVVCQADTFEVVEKAWAQQEVSFPYIPGLLSFREIPVLSRALAKVKAEPDVIFVDGHGQAHPRRLGIASHLGLYLNRPTIGVAKSLLTGHLSSTDNSTPGTTTDIVDHDEVIGTALWTKSRAKPIFISPGHLIDQSSATNLVRASLRGYRLPEPTRLAHEYVNEMRRQHPTLNDVTE